MAGTVAQPLRPSRADGEKVTRGAERRGDVVRVLIVDDHDLLRTGLATLLGAQQGIDLVAQALGGVKQSRLRMSSSPTSC